MEANVPDLAALTSEPGVLTVIPASHGMPGFVLYKNNRWAVLGLPPKFARASDDDLRRCLAGKKYSELNADERRVYNRLSKRKSDAKLADDAAVQARRCGARKISMRAFYVRLRHEGRLHAYYHDQADKNRVRRQARRRQQGESHPAP
jgi:hypothetical protein